MAIDTTQAVRIKTVVTQDGELHLRGPFRAGENVEVIILADHVVATDERYPLQGIAYSFVDPFSGVAIEEWEALQ
mgnify:CR=1 FL=1|jgi:hypothetical protein